MNAEILEELRNMNKSMEEIKQLFRDTIIYLRSRSESSLESSPASSPASSPVWGSGSELPSSCSELSQFSQEARLGNSLRTHFNTLGHAFSPSIKDSDEVYGDGPLEEETKSIVL